MRRARPDARAVARSLLRSALVAVVVALLLPLGPVANAAQGPYAGGDEGTGIPPVAATMAPTLQRASIEWADVTGAHAWARSAIDHVAGARNWMRDYEALDDGTYPFKPDRLESRRHFARAVVRAFAPSDSPDPALGFDDLETSSRFWSSANVAVSRGWMTTSGRSFRPNDPVTTNAVHRALVLAIGLRPAVRELNAIHTADGKGFKTPGTFGTNVLALRLNLRYPSQYEDHDVNPWTPLTRAQVAYSLSRAASVASTSTIPYLLDQYAEVELPRMGDARRAIVSWGVRFAGFPYVWGGEWGLKEKAPSALGGQSIPGFDCSGFAWWLMRRNDGSAWQVAPPRPYRGWSLPERSSASMAGATRNRLRFQELDPGDLMFYDGDRDGVVDHVDVYVGNGWALDSSNSPAGVTLMWVGSGWYRDHFEFGRRITT